MTSGMSCFIEFKSEEAEHRFKTWIKKGNAKSDSLGVGSLGLNAKALKVDSNKYVFFWNHIFMVNMALFLRMMIWIQFRKVRKFVTISRLSKNDAVEMLIDRGSKIE